ncbi:MAG: hypothetical protein ACPLRU_08010 [Desulfofundulus sp.]
MPKYRVTAEFVDLEAEQRRFPGETVEVSLERAKVLIGKGVIYSTPLEDVKKEADAQSAEKPKKEDNETADEKPGRSKQK